MEENNSSFFVFFPTLSIRIVASGVAWERINEAEIESRAWVIVIGGPATFRSANQGLCSLPGLPPAGACYIKQAPDDITRLYGNDVEGNGELVNGNIQEPGQLDPHNQEGQMESCGDGLWVLTRAPLPGRQAIVEAKSAVRALGLDDSVLQPVRQVDCP